MEQNWKLEDFDFPLEEDRIAKYPPKNRGDSHLLTVNRKTSAIRYEDKFTNLLEYLVPGDILVFNNTRVSKRRVFLLTNSGRIHETIFLEENGELWKVLLKNASKVKNNDTLWDASGYFGFEVIRRKNGDTFLRPSIKLSEEIFEKIGTIPIPPYLKRKAEALDEDRYQTIFASVPGSVAAPTAGLHFSREFEDRLRQFGIRFLEVTLNVGYGTFAPLLESQIEKKELHEESYYISPGVAESLNQSRGKNRIISIGTTTLRALETSIDSNSGMFRDGYSSTKKFITPDDKILSIDGLITNFHLPKSSLLLLVSAFIGKDLLLDSYHEAIKRNMKFFSYGDAMFLY